MIHINFLIQSFVWTLVTQTETDTKYKKSGVGEVLGDNFLGGF